MDAPVIEASKIEDIGTNEELEKMTVTKLKALAKALGVKVFQKPIKKNIIYALINARDYKKNEEARAALYNERLYSESIEK